MSVLLIDAGNTRLEWRYWQAGQCLDTQEAAYDELPAHWPRADRVIVATVAQQQRLAELLQPHLSQQIEWWTQPQLGVAQFKHCYSHPERLGVDRWLAMLGARAKAPQDAVLVVDAGTAMTIDLLSADNQHLGGYIVPGIQMAQQALFNRTERVRPYQDEQQPIDMPLGQHTVACVSLGAQRQSLALVKDVAKQYGTFKLFVTGGDGLWIAQQLNAQYHHNLVLDGMEFLCAGYL